MSDNNDKLFERLHDLVMLQLEGQLTDQQHEELTCLLQGDDQAQELYVQAMQDVTSLRWWCFESSPSDSFHASLGGAARRQAPEPSERRLWALASTALLAISATILLAGSALFLLFSPTKDGAVATLTRIRGITWSDSEAPLAEMSRLSVGEEFRIEGGEAEIYFDDAVQLLVRGPACVEICSSREVRSPYGVLSARVGEAGKGFTIHTPSGKITDLGTEFGVAISDEGSTEVAVFRGAVDLSYEARQKQHPANSTRRLIQGQALHLGTDGSTRRVAFIDSARYPSVHGLYNPASPPRPALFKSISDNLRESDAPKFYRIVPGGLWEDVPAYVDRQHQWNGIDESGIPEMLLGADYVMPFNQDKYQPHVEVTLEIGHPATLYIFLSDMAVVPDWLTKDFIDTGLKIGLDESGEFTNPSYRLATGPGVKIDTHFSIWKRAITAPGSVKLGSIRRNTKPGFGFCMYGIAATPLEVVTDPVR